MTENVSARQRFIIKAIIAPMLEVIWGGWSVYMLAQIQWLPDNAGFNTWWYNLKFFAGSFADASAFMVAIVIGVFIGWCLYRRRAHRG